MPVPNAIEQTSLSYELLIVISCMSVSVVMLLFSIASISYVVHKRYEVMINYMQVYFNDLIGLMELDCKFLC